MSYNITIEGGKSVRLPTAGKYCDRDIIITAEGGGDGILVCNDTNNIDKTVSVDTIEQLRISYPNATKVGMSAFSYCDNLISISATEVVTIRENAFFRCTSLVSINFPKLEQIEPFAFMRCTSLPSINFPEAFAIGQQAFSGCTLLTDVNLPEVHRLDYSVFCDCTSLKSVEFPSAVYIENYAFEGCTSLTNIELPIASSIGQLAFVGCASLSNINLPKVKNIDADAFYGCTSFDTLILSNYELVCNLNVTAILGTKIATAQGMPTGEGFIYVRERLYEQYLANITEQAYMLLIYSGYSEAEAEYMASYIAMAVLRTIEGGAQATTFGLRNPLANFKGFTEEAIETFKTNYKSEEAIKWHK